MGVWECAVAPESSFVDVIIIVIEKSVLFCESKFGFLNMAGGDYASLA
jgi:hypothetical protein